VQAALRADDQDEGFTPLRPLYVLSSDGNLHSIRPSDGEDMAPAKKFVPGGAYASSLNVARDFVYATTSAGCGGAPDGVWALNVNSPSEKAQSLSGEDERRAAQCGCFGRIYGNDLQRLRRRRFLPEAWRSAAERSLLFCTAGERDPDRV
jgi:hypothetical protein